MSRHSAVLESKSQAASLGGHASIRDIRSTSSRDLSKPRKSSSRDLGRRQSGKSIDKSKQSFHTAVASFDPIPVVPDEIVKVLMEFDRVHIKAVKKGADYARLRRYLYKDQPKTARKLQLITLHATKNDLLSRQVAQQVVENFIRREGIRLQKVMDNVSEKEMWQKIKRIENIVNKKRYGTDIQTEVQYAIHGCENKVRREVYRDCMDLMAVIRTVMTSRLKSSALEHDDYDDDERVDPSVAMNFLYICCPCCYTKLVYPQKYIKPSKV